MKQLEHTGNTCAVNWTCFTGFDITDEDMQFIKTCFPSACKAYKSCYVSVPMAEWKAAYQVFAVALRLMGLSINYEPSCFSHLPQKAREWCAVKPLETLYRHDNETGQVHKIV